MKQPLIRNALVVGAGISGMAAAIALRQLGTIVDLVEIDPSWRSDADDIVVSAAALRALRALGIAESDLAQAAMSGRDAVVPHPLLAKILADATIKAGADVRLGITIRSLRQDADGVDVEFTDTRSARYGLLIGADGLHSKLRDLLLRATSRAPSGEQDALPLHHVRALLIGDALHGSTATFSSHPGAGMEHAVVLAHALSRASSVAHALAEFEQRCRENSPIAPIAAASWAEP